jgi:DNA-binding winged helix-turn-helix (wHTH) protein
MPAEGSVKIGFGPFEFDSRNGRLSKNGHRIKLQPKSAAILECLLGCPGEIVNREELKKRLWPAGTYVDFDLGIKVAVKKLRDALGDSPDDPLYIQTIHGEGYQFIEQVTLEANAVQGKGEPATQAESRIWAAIPQATRRARLWPAWITACVVAVALATLFGWRAHSARNPRIAFNARDWVLIANFENRTGEPLLDGTLEYALERELSNSQYVNVVPRERVEDALRLMKKPLDTKIEAALGKEICVRDGGIRALLTGRVEKLGSTYVLSVNLLDPVRGVTVASLSEEDPPDSQMAANVRHISNRVRETLGEEHQLVQQYQQRLEKVTTPSLHALQLYTRADESIRLGFNEEAGELLERALQDDPDFASAHLLLGSVYEGSHDESKAMPHFQRAFDSADSTTDRERFFIRGMYYFEVSKDPQRANDRQKAIEALEALLRLYPDHFGGADALIHQYFNVGRTDDAARLLVRLADSLPSDFPANARAAWAKAILQQDWNGARSYFKRASALLEVEGDTVDPSVATWVKLFPAYELWLHGDAAAAHTELIQVENTYKSLDPLDVGIFFLNFGELKKAGELFQAQRDTAAREDGAALIAFLRGDRPELKKHLQRALSFAIPGTAVSIFMVRTGMWPEVERAIRTRSPRRGSLITEGELALAQGDSAKGISLLEEGLQSCRTIPAVAFFLGSESLAKTYKKQGKLDEALRVLLQASQDRGRTLAGPNSFQTNAAFWMRTELQLADLYRETGRLPEAEKIEEELLKLLAYADPDYPLLGQLKQRYSTAMAYFPR